MRRAPLSEESRRKIAASLRLAHLLHPRSAELRKKSSDSTRQRYADGHKFGFKPGNRFGGGIRTPESIKLAVEASNAVCRGAHQFGRMKRGRPDHAMAYRWVIESPGGMRYDISNLLEWCRQHESLLPSGESSYKQPVWRRSANGLYRQIHSKDPRCQWRGWRVLRVLPLETA